MQPVWRRQQERLTSQGLQTSRMKSMQWGSSQQRARGPGRVYTFAFSGRSAAREINSRLESGSDLSEVSVSMRSTTKMAARRAPRPQRKTPTKMKVFRSRSTARLGPGVAEEK